MKALQFSWDEQKVFLKMSLQGSYQTQTIAMMKNDLSCLA